MQQWVGRRWMIGVSIETACQRLRWSRTTGTLDHCHSLIARWVQRLHIVYNCLSLSVCLSVYVLKCWRRQQSASYAPYKPTVSIFATTHRAMTSSTWRPRPWLNPTLGVWSWVVVTGSCYVVWRWRRDVRTTSWETRTTTVSVTSYSATECASVSHANLCAIAGYEITNKQQR